LANEVVLRSREREQALEREHATATENARLYQEARDALRLRDQFLSIAAHELKTPLTVLLGNIHLLQRRAIPHEPLSERNLRTIHRVGMQAERLNMLIGTMLDLSRLETGQFHLEQVRLDLGALVQRVVEDMRPMSESHTIVYTAPDRPLVVHGDVVRLEQVLQNLLHNAIKYSPLGGTVAIDLACMEGMVRIEVTDQGMGIPQDVLPNLFTRFYRAPNVDYRNISGMGIGLYIVKEIVTRHGGRVEIQSAEGQGSTFRLFLPEPDVDDLFNNRDARAEDEEQQQEYLGGR